jgi:hypothetical protein
MLELYEQAMLNLDQFPPERQAYYKLRIDISKAEYEVQRVIDEMAEELAGSNPEPALP